MQSFNQLKRVDMFLVHILLPEPIFLVTRGMLW